jgi:hypothetical protein
MEINDRAYAIHQCFEDVSKMASELEPAGQRKTSDSFGRLGTNPRQGAPGALQVHPSAGVGGFRPETVARIVWLEH